MTENSEIPETGSVPKKCTSLQERHIVRWYALVFPSRTRSASSDMQQELVRRHKTGEPSFEYFAPSFTQVKEIKGRLVATQRALLYNYIFVHASESEIYRMKQRLPQYNFLPRVHDGKDRYHYPFLSDEAMRNLQWVANSYAGAVPVYAADPAWLIKGDRIRIIEGQFKGVEARIVSRPRSRQKDVMICINDWMWVPLLQVRSDQYAVIGFCDNDERIHAHLNNDRIQTRLHEALCRHHCQQTTEEDRSLASETVLRYAHLTVASDIMRSKLYSLLLPAYTILEDKPKCEGLIQIIRVMLPAVKAAQARALLLVTLYGCTDNSIYYDMAHSAVDPWSAELPIKKSKAELIGRLADYDRCLGHCINR